VAAVQLVEKQTRTLKPNRSASPRNLPENPPTLIGRDASLAAVKSRLLNTDSHSYAPVVLQGLLGIGKSTLAAALIHDPEVKRHFTDGVLWATLGDNPDPHTTLRRWAALFGIHGADIGGFPHGISTRLASYMHNRRMLLVLDDVWDMGDLRYLLIGGHRSRSIVSTRQGRVANALAVSPDDIFKLLLLTHAQSMQLISRLAPHIDDHPLLGDLVTMLDGLPLTLQIAAQLFSEDSAPRVADFAFYQRILMAKMPASYVCARPQSILSTLESLLAVLSPEAQRDFFRLSEPDIDISGNAEMRRSIRELVGSGLLDVASEGHFRLHGLLRAFARIKGLPPQKPDESPSNC
jgi:hypothetical protein